MFQQGFPDLLYKVLFQIAKRFIHKYQNKQLFNKFNHQYTPSSCSVQRNKILCTVPLISRPRCTRLLMSSFLSPCYSSPMEGSAGHWGEYYGIQTPIYHFTVRNLHTRASFIIQSERPAFFRKAGGPRSACTEYACSEMRVALLRAHAPIYCSKESATQRRQN